MTDPIRPKGPPIAVNEALARTEADPGRKRAALITVAVAAVAAVVLVAGLTFMGHGKVSPSNIESETAATARAASGTTAPR